MKRLYDLFVLLFAGLAKSLSFCHTKTRLLVKGQRHTLSSIERFKSKRREELTWFHAASLGEYEQAKPVILSYRKSFPDQAILLTFFSPSGYENTIKKTQEPVDLITYLPFDTASNAKRFLEATNPKRVFFVKYEVWPNYLAEVRKKHIPLYLFSASFRSDQIYFKSYGGLFRQALGHFDHIFTQNSASVSLLEKIGIDKVSLSGDTRFDRVHMTRMNPKSFPELSPFTNGHKVMVIGSAWQEDMDILLPYINSMQGFQYIIAPHDINHQVIESWKAAIKHKSQRYSEWLKNPDIEAKLLFIDNIGMLSSLYQFAYIAYVGGAFGKGLHNILEPIAFGIPVVFGKLRKESKFPEAGIAELAGCGFSVENAVQLNTVLTQLQEGDRYVKACKASEEYVEANLGSATKIIDKVIQLEKKDER
ncbi:3-deoxy-D-manno-octulosonic acid transferase [Pararhodonellum marinum]|uniref:3-deoxy-D-manno-octulosonic acid transferase n=1 Tax=Pararhodonellum marinum TaxID=2755358 RepID=UPI00188FF794|nr:glycosyltransferase N-terminal domain-containing protein [Pararhodonellum marinum]